MMSLLSNRCYFNGRLGSWHGLLANCLWRRFDYVASH